MAMPFRLSDILMSGLVVLTTLWSTWLRMGSVLLNLRLLVDHSHPSMKKYDLISDEAQLGIVADFSRSPFTSVVLL